MKNIFYLIKPFLILLYFIIVLNSFIFLTYVVSRPINFLLEQYRKINIINQSKVISRLQKTKLKEASEKLSYTQPVLFNAYVKPVIGNTDLL